MAIRFQCSGCGKQFTVKEQYAGKKTRCDRCGRVIEVPRTSTLQDEELDRREKFITFTRLAARPKPRRRKLPVTTLVILLIAGISVFVAWRYFNAPYRRGVRLFEKGSYSEAAGEFKKGMGSGSNVGRCHIYLGRIYAVQKDYKKAISECKSALEVAPKSRDAHFYLIIIYQLDNQMAEAERTWDKASNLPGTDRGFTLSRIMPPPSGSALTPEAIAVYNDILKGIRRKSQKKNPGRLF